MALKPKSFIRNGEFLRVGDYIRSSNHRFFVVMQGDGNLAVYRSDTPGASYSKYTWGTANTGPGGQFYAVMQGDGNLCVYRGTDPGDSHGLLWDAQRTGPGHDFYLILQDDGNLCVYAGKDPEDQRQLVWDSHVFDGPGTDISSVNPALNKAIRMAVLAAFKQVPKAGAMISGLVGVLWPESGKDTWSEIRSRIEALINKRLAEFKYQEVKEKLEGLKNVVVLYADAVQDGRNSSAVQITRFYDDAVAHFAAAKPHFMSREYEALLLPMLAQMANMHLALLRDGVQHGSEWGWNAASKATAHRNLKDAIRTYGEWVGKWYRDGYEAFPTPQPGESNKIQWRLRNAYVRSMTLQVLDIAFYWPYFDPDNGPAPKMTREVYSDPHGSAKAGENPIAIDSSVKPQLSALAIWGGSRLDAVQQAFGSGGLGPRQGSPSGGSQDPPQGWNGRIDPNNPVVEVVGFAGEVVGSILLVFKDGSRTHLCGKPDGGLFTCFLEGHVLSQIYISGKNRFYGVAETIICGFRLEDSY